MAPSNWAVAGAVGVLVAAAIGVGWAAFQPPRTPRPTAVRSRRSSVTGTVVAAAGAVFVVVLVVSGWLVLAVAAAGLVVVWSSLFESAFATRERRRIDAIAKWLEDLRDLQAGSNFDLLQALDRSATRAPKEISSELARFVDRVRHHVDLDVALRQLADDLDHPTSDLAVAAMLFAQQRASGAELFGTFDQLAASARSELQGRDEIDRMRVRFESAMRRMIVILGVLIVYMRVFSSETLREYSTNAGQVVLVVPVAIWATALWWLRHLARYRRAGRFLAGGVTAVMV